MNGFRMLCSAPNWYQSSLCDCSSQGIVAIGTHRSITLLMVTPSNHSNDANNDHLFIGELLGHKDRVQCCKFSFFASNILAPNNNKDTFNELLISASYDCSIRIWNIDTKQCIMLLNHLHPITALNATNSNINDKRPKTDTLIISGDSKGFVMCWNPITNNRVKKRVSDTMVMIIEICPFNEERVGIGYKSGTLLLLGINEHNINELCRFNGHQNEIQSLSFCHKYKSEEKKDDDDRTIMDYLPNVFVTAGKDKYIRFWNTLNGECLLEIQIEAKKDMKQSAKQRNWYSLLWLMPFRVFVTNSNGKIWSINIKEIIMNNNTKTICLNKQNDDIFTMFEEGHSRCIFSLIPIKNRPQHILSVSLDRNIIYWNINTLKTIWTLRCLGGYVYDLDCAKWNPSLLAVAVGDKMIRIWTDEDKDNNNYKLNPFYKLNNNKYRHKKKRKKKRKHNINSYCTAIWRGLKDKITAIKWHPTDIGWLCYGTDKGCVGCLDIHSESSGARVRLLTYHATDIIQIDWKIIAMKYRKDYNTQKEKESGFRVYSLSKDGTIFEGDGWKPNAPSININKYILAANDNVKDVLRTSSDKDIVWTCFCMELMNPYDVYKYKDAVHKMKTKDEYDVDLNEFSGQKMVIGTSNGFIYIFNGDWKLLCLLNDYNALITCIHINPFHNVVPDTLNECNHLMAVGTVDGYILFYDLNDTKHRMIHKAKHSPKHKSVIKIKWNAFDPNIMVSISMDKRYPLIVWDLSMISNGKTRKVMHIESDINKYPAHSSWFSAYHHSRYLSMEWSHKDPFILYTASEDQTCRRLNIKDILSSTNPNIKCDDDIRYHSLKSAIFHCSILSEPIKVNNNNNKIQSKPSNVNMKQSVRIQKHHKLFKSFDSQKLEISINSLWQFIQYFAGFISPNTNDYAITNMKLEPIDTLLLYTNDIEDQKDEISNWMKSVLQNQQSGSYPMELMSCVSFEMQHLMQNNNSESMIEKQLNTFHKKINKTSLPELPSLLSLLISPTFGRQKWIKSMLRLCEYYKHPKIKLYHNAAAIYLSLKSAEYICECINMYCDIDCYAEALIIARFHLLPNHPIIKKILCLFAEKCLSKKRYIMAIKCYLSTLSIYDKDIYSKQFMEIMEKYVFEILLKYYFVNSFESEYNTFRSNKNINIKKRRIGTHDLCPLLLLYDVIVLLCDIFSTLNQQKEITDFLLNAIGKQTIHHIFSIYWTLTLCIYSQSPDIKHILDSKKAYSMKKWSPFINSSELTLWRLLLRFVSMIEVDTYCVKDIDISDIEPLDTNNILETYSNIQFTFRINHILKNYTLPNDDYQLQRIHCIKFGNYLLECYLCYKSSDNTNRFESIIWQSLNYSSTHNTLLLLHQYIGCLFSFWKKDCDDILSIAVQSIFATLDLLSHDLYNIGNVNIRNIIKDYVNIINKLYETNESFKCKLIIKFLVVLMSFVSVTDSVYNELNKQINLWISVQSIMNDESINKIEILITKCKNMFSSQKQLRDPYLRKYNSRSVAHKYLYSIIDTVCT